MPEPHQTSKGFSCVDSPDNGHPDFRAPPLRPFLLPDQRPIAMGYVRNSEQLSVFDTDKVIESFNQYLTRFEFDATIASGEALQKIAVFKDKPEAHLIVRVCLAIANADGHFDSAEQQALDQICRSLNLDIKTFI